LGTLIGIVVGVVATVLVSHYYYRRSTRKSLKAYLILNSQVFAGIEPAVRQELHFSFHGDEVAELQHIEFLVANDGERAVSDLIEPLRLALPKGVRILDASILYRSPDTLQATVETAAPPNASPNLVITFPLLNKGEYFAIKLLLSGRVPLDALVFTLLAGDLPRSIKAEWLPPTARHEPGTRVEWPAVIGGIFLMILAAGILHALYMVRTFRPELFPYPWHLFRPTWHALPMAITAAAGLVLAFLGCVFATFIGFGGLFARKGRFSLPSELLRRRGSFVLEALLHEGEGVATDSTPAAKRSNREDR
jgi:hypothetical protein